MGPWAKESETGKKRTERRYPIQVELSGRNLRSVILNQSNSSLECSEKNIRVFQSENVPRAHLSTIWRAETQGQRPGLITPSVRKMAELRLRVVNFGNLPLHSAS